MKKNIFLAIILGITFALTSCGFKGQEKVVYDACMKIDGELFKNFDKGFNLPVETSSRKSACKSMIENIRKEAKETGEDKEKLLSQVLFIFNLISAK